MNKRITVAEMVDLLADSRPQSQFALFDARDEGVFARSHMLYACSLPLSDLEIRLPRLVPGHDTLIVLTSSKGDGMAERARARCAALGYRNVRLLDGGNEAWADAGHSLFSGIHVPSKAFGELVENFYRTPMIEPKELHELIERGERLEVFDSRPPHEFQRMSLPGARNCPGADLVAHIPSLVRDPETLVVINCAGRTRSIIGAQSLIGAGSPNKVVALKNGTMGWHLAGFTLEHGKSALVPEVADSDMVDSRRMASEVRRKFGIRTISATQLDAARKSADSSPLLLDVRGPWEFDKAHLPGSRCAPGGQIVQATDLYIAVRNAPVVLIDDDGVRASITASWLVQMGIADVSVLDYLHARQLFTGKGKSVGDRAHLAPEVDAVDAAQLRARLEDGEVAVIDIGRSDAFYKGHIPGAQFAIRSRFAASIPRLKSKAGLVLVAEDDTIAAFAAVEAAALYGGPVQVLKGGLQAWCNAGFPLANGLEDSLDPPEDMWHIPSSPLGGGETAMKNYISWEIDLARQVADEPGTRFRVGHELNVSNEEAALSHRVSVSSLIQRRWSPRSMNGKPLTDEEIHALFDAARWAPSSNNSQPWRFVFARRDSSQWAEFFDLLADGNKRWAGQGAILAFVLSLEADPKTGKAFRSHSYDTGAAWQNIALQGQSMGLVVHGMLGFDAARARSLLGLPDDVSIEAMFVAGRPAPADRLPPDLQRKEVPSDRLPLDKLLFEGEIDLPQKEKPVATGA